MDELVFRTMGEVKAIFETLGDKPRVLELPVDKDRLEKWLNRHAGGNPFQAAHLWAIEYRKRHRDSCR